jgi:cobalt-zinc-cadmium efflux system outer membrane protein
MSRAMFAAVCLLASSGGIAVADDITFADVVAAAQHAPALVATQADIRAADARIDAARAWPSPGISVQTNRLTAKVVAGATVPLPLFGTVGAAERVASAEASLVRSDSAVADREVIRTAALAWIALARAEGDSAAAALAAAQARELEAIAKGRLDTGAGAVVDVSTASAARARADLAVTAAEHERAARAAELAGTLGWDAHHALTTKGDLPGRDVPAIGDLEHTLAAHPEHARAQHAIAVTEAHAHEARISRFPTLAVEGAVAVDDPETPGTDVMLGLSLDLPIFSRASDRIRAATASRDAERARMKALDAQLAANLTAAERRWEAAKETENQLSAVIVPAQENVAKLALTAYQEGARDLETAIIAARDLASARAELVTARAELASAWVQLLDASGRDAAAGARGQP